MQPTPTTCRTAVSTAASLFAVLLLTVALPLPTVSQAAELAQTDIPLAPPPPPLDQRPPQSDPSSAADPSPSADPADGAPRPLLPSEPAEESAEEPVVSAPPPQTEPPETEPPVRPAAEPAPEATPTPAALPEPDGEDGQVPLPPRRPAPPTDAVAAPPSPAPPSPAAPLSGDAATFTDEGSQRFGRDLDAPRAGFLRVAGDLHWERAPIPPAVKTACTTRVARLGSSVAASFKEQGLWTPPEALTLTVDCDDGEERPIGTFVCKAQDFAPVLDLSCRLQPPAR